jgi:glycosidase
VRINVAAQKTDPDSIRSYYKKMIALRASSDALKYGSFRLAAAKKHFFAFDREYEGQTLRVLLNFGESERRFPCEGLVVISNYARTAYDGVLRPWEAVIIDKGVKP